MNHLGHLHMPLRGLIEGRTDQFGIHWRSMSITSSALVNQQHEGDHVLWLLMIDGMA